MATYSNDEMVDMHMCTAKLQEMANYIKNDFRQGVVLIIIILQELNDVYGKLGLSMQCPAIEDETAMSCVLQKWKNKCCSRLRTCRQPVRKQFQLKWLFRTFQCR